MAFCSTGSRASSSASCTTTSSTPSGRKFRLRGDDACQGHRDQDQRGAAELTLSNGVEISARLVVLANGLNVGLRHTLGIERQIVSACHSISLGFDLAPIGRAAFDFPALTYFSERSSDQITYVTVFPVGT